SAARHRRGPGARRHHNAHRPHSTERHQATVRGDGGLERALGETVRVFSATVGLACFLLVVVAYQPYRDVARGRAAEQALRGPPTSLGELRPTGPSEAVHVAGGLVAAPDVRREQPLESATTWRAAPPRSVYTLAQGTRLRDSSGEVAMDGPGVDVAGAPGDYAYGTAIVVYGAAQPESIEPWAIALDARGLEEAAAAQTGVLRWPWAAAGLLVGCAGYLFSLAGTYAIVRAFSSGLPPGPRLAALALACYLVIGFGLLGNAWAMLEPMVGGTVTAAGAAALLGRGAQAPPPASPRRASSKRTQ